jgi:glycerol-3-phosphate dehydrogenase subunit C
MYDEDARLLAENTYDFNEFMLSQLNQGQFDTDLSPVPHTLVYHIPCQYRGHRIGKPGLQLMGLIPGLTLIDSHADCCGIAGTYGYKKEKYAISMEIGQPLFDLISNGYPDSPIVVCDSETCRWQITHATGKPAFHPVELLALSYGLSVIPQLQSS